MIKYSKQMLYLEENLSQQVDQCCFFKDNPLRYLAAVFFPFDEPDVTIFNFYSGDVAVTEAATTCIEVGVF